MGQGRRLDVELMERGLVDSRRAAQREIAAGRVEVDGVVVTKPARSVAAGQVIAVAEAAEAYVSRAGHKLAAALDELSIDVDGARCVDVGASTGGFTDCLLQRGARSVVAVDVGTGQLHPRLVADPRVDDRQRTDIRHLDPASVVGPIGVVTIDVSFITLAHVLPAIAVLLERQRPSGGSSTVVALVKPQFEAGRDAVKAGRGVVRDPAIWRRVLLDTADAAADCGFEVEAVTAAPVAGARGNREFLTRLRHPARGGVSPPGRWVAYARLIDDIDDAVARAQAVPA